MLRSVFASGFMVLICASFFSGLKAQESNATLRAIQMDVAYLSSDLLEGRETGKQGEQMAAEYIADRLEAIGLTAKGSDGWFQPFEFKQAANPHAPAEEGKSRNGKNVVGYIDNGQDYTIVIGAHYDHLGYGHFGSLHAGEEAIHNGADDNASGVAAMIEIARQLKGWEEARHNFMIIGFSAEELGLVGSKYFCSEPTLDLNQISCMINLDMVGRLNAERSLVINGVGTSPEWMETLPDLAKDRFKLKTTESGIGASDHTAFYLEEIPAVHFFTGQHQDYHKPSDDSHLVNYQGIQDIADYIVLLIKELDATDLMEFTKTKDDQERQAASFKVSLGVMPDYVSDTEGMRIDAVIDGRPAAKAGLEDGDVVIELGGEKIKDIYGYMEALSKFKKGDSTSIKVKRGDEVIEKTVSF